MSARAAQVAAIRAATFGLALVLTLLALGSQLSELSESLFSAHMAQHLMLIMVCAPLFAAARPAHVFFRILPLSARRWLAALSRRRLARLLAFFFSPVAIWLYFVGVFSAWHIPGLYARALADEAIHIAEHLSFFLAAFGFWSVAFGLYPAHALSLGARVLYVASAALLSALPGALIAIAPRPLYAAHRLGAISFGLTPLEDQQLAGLVMWIPGGFVYMGVILGLLVLCLRRAERRATLRHASPVLALLLVGSGLAGCDDEPAANLLAKGEAPRIEGDAQTGAREIEKIGCGSCHTIPGIAGARGLVGPPLTAMGRRIYIAGLLRNTPENLATWLRDPQKIVPGNAMPNMHLSDDQRRDIAAYLTTLR
ncbi:cytochrome c oxidase assembly protein [Methylocystis sp. MJC1]|uniref:cytochrome c oxidase assembly protein n=1 Tax=Methylocystis sp. MJC1 TaxID=2654282 RepID=UPI0013EC86C6|nr:cytochrome c oxidase assembly protein [Methylocystis sp. MJC1]KAF2989931.1 cytochrome c oxidase subunit 2 [Methylocystis sp. MJC1]MBU6528302.1 cytochrome c oxidase assembly protein [Methylocystis sp. MJC1]UZX11209.1 cytochrome c oxidase assembly protein [Methylocystis sp. MJC1]